MTTRDEAIAAAAEVYGAILADPERREQLRAARAAKIRVTGGIVPAPVTKAICAPDCDWLTTRTHHPDCVT